ncbi:MAG: redox-sensing transcriptional repressor Rex [Oscillospiraceae bacterium]|nr:redox-sensing transcriptional repressor Rex [Oscillospiraceae bacterium]
MSKKSEISSSVIKRLPRYYRFTDELIKQGYTRISSQELSEKMSLTASQIRQDLNCFGGFGQQGYGYNLTELHSEIGKILGVDRRFETVLIGAGNLGKAIAQHMNFEKKGCHLAAIFDSDPEKSGEIISGLSVNPMDKLEELCSEIKPAIAVLCIPKSAAQELADRLVNLGIKGFWNFSHYDLKLDYSNIVVENVHLGDSLLTLTYGVSGMTDK